MTYNEQDISAMLGSRICHDLISPIGAISNGVELLGMTAPPSAELELVDDSVASANFRIRFFRIAYGTAASDHIVNASEIKDILAGLERFGRVKYQWDIDGALPRQIAKLVFLLLQGVEQALPQGGTIEVSGPANSPRLVAFGAEVRPDPEMWAIVTQDENKAQVSPSTIHFPLARHLLDDIGAQVTIDQIETGMGVAIIAPQARQE